ncbi:MAG TPA: enoyl-CoA hydratase/isomerase family protein [Rubrivivax sp.]|jgi:enoyl-CoA hydratase|nr:enoyl-CoA hydratase/isomerase family protein [Burkholderiaceae bacterium]HMR70706.1 enoyl-CoA hydratase/isomerase family protein [Rubrivivax sp.]
MELEQIIYEKQGNVATITLNRPDKLNTVTREMFTSWGRAITMAEEDDEVKVIVMKGAGRCFSAGAPLDQVGYVYGMKEPKPGEKAGKVPMRVKINFDRSLFNDFFRKVLLCRKLTVVQMHKYCLGVAFSIAMHADLLIADEDCQFGHVEERLGLAGLTVMPIMVARCGLTKALDLCLTGKKIDARTALEWNLINRVVPTDRLEAEVQELAAGLSLYPRDGIAIAKVARELMYETMGITRGTLEHYIMHTFQTNRVYEPDEYNAFKERRDQGVKGMAHGKHNLFSALDK